MWRASLTLSMTVMLMKWVCKDKNGGLLRSREVVRLCGCEED
jgi:hypothetical protein